MRVIKRFFYLFLLILLPVVAVGQNIEQQERMKKQIEEEIAFLDSQLASTKKKQADNTKELNFIRRKISNRKKLLAQIESEIRQINKEMTHNESEINRLNRDLSNLKKEYSNLIYEAYKNRDQSSWMMYVLASENIDQGYRRWVYFKDFNKSMQSRASRIKKTSEEITNRVDALEKMKEKSLKSQQQRSSEYKKLQTDERGARQTITQLSKQERTFRTQLAAKRKEVERLNKEIERILAEAMKAKESPDFKESAAERKLSANFELNKGKLPWPVKRGAVVEEFGQHNHPVFKNVKLPFNNGVNIATDKNAEVFCVFDGLVKQILVMPGYNQCVLVQHGNFYTFYTKLDRVSVKSGDKIKTGQSIGNLAAADDNGSIIHFQLWHGTNKQNPEHWISK
ncbi:MAG: peptidoglycan DD-metalloendopeptidase family protein [Bacteroidales bacterium]|jgi:septal ring factor EnvC (AmiA/AmiB activator)|nr:peptidoglycan DD-metalloendopeptidase family protein [Bacteroidales bacterium]MDD3273124.1 peptidoglycan DD-metalloendopeptidase family protein [Bacteroidales bacterium]MDD4058453.1 peptidoglycan DD-metalloendopeptidase family protein [Bacteroidales bacterium]